MSRVSLTAACLGWAIVMPRRSHWIDEDVARYAIAHSTAPDAIVESLVRETKAKLGPQSRMQISPQQSHFLHLVARAIGARCAVEVGTFTGLSALSVARALPDDGRLLCCDVSEEWTAIGRPYWEQAGVAHKIDLRIGPALDTLRALPPDTTFDLAFIDADKSNYASYYETLLPLTRADGLIVIDNTLWSGTVLDDTVTDADTVAIRSLNDALVADDRVEVVLLPISDGLTLVRKR
jgi:caffeoyl-CoA O-methyltransferase